MFKGRHYHTIDAKGRLSIPSGFRLELRGSGEQAPIVTNGVTGFGICLLLYRHEDWCEMTASLAELPPEDLDVQAYTRFVVSGASDCPIDNQGRVLLPSILRKWAKLEREVTIAGAGNRIEIWDKSLFDENQAKTQEDFQRIASAVAGLKR